MTLVMLLGMVPVGHAESGNMMPGGDFTVSCNHNWTGDGRMVSPLIVRIGS